MPADGFGDEEMCTSGKMGSSDDERHPGIPCVFPFTYKGVKYEDSCANVPPPGATTPVADGWGWCATDEDFDKGTVKWGSCQYCSDVEGGFQEELLDMEYEEYEDLQRGINEYETDLPTFIVRAEGPASRFFKGLVVLCAVALIIRALQKFVEFARSRTASYRRLAPDADLDLPAFSTNGSFGSGTATAIGPSKGSKVSIA